MISIANIEKYKHFYYPAKDLYTRFIISSLESNDEYYDFLLDKVITDEYGDTHRNNAGYVRLYRNVDFSMESVAYYLLEMCISNVTIKNYISIDTLSNRHKFNYFIDSRIKESFNIR